MESWVVSFGSAVIGGSFTVIVTSIWLGRNAVTKDDLINATAATTTEVHELRDLIAAERREIGESLHALREKINTVELDAAKTYVRRESWHQAMNALQDSISKSDAADQQWKLRIEEKLDRLAERISSQGHS